MFSLYRISKASAVFAVGVASVSLSLLAQPVQAQVSLVGALLMSAAPTGQDTTNGAYQYTTNTSIGRDPLILTFNGTTYNKGIAIPLSAGDNVFIFTNAGVNPGNFAGLEIFLNNTAVSYNPNGGGRAGDLDVARDTASANPFFVPASTTQIANYSASATTLPYSGASSFLVGVQSVSFTAFNVNTAAQGGFTLRVARTGAPATPEPGSIALLAGFGISGGLFLKRRKK